MVEGRRAGWAAVRAPLLAMALLAPAALAAPAPAAEEVYAALFDGPAWHAVDLAIDRPTFLTARADAEPRLARAVAGGLWLLDARGAVVASTTHAAWSGTLLQARVELGLAGELLDAAQAAGPPGLGLRIDRVLDAGAYTLLAVVAGDAAVRGEVRVAADAPARAGDARGGDAVTFLRDEDLGAEAHALASVPTLPNLGPAQVRAVQRGSHGQVVEHRLFGAFHGAASVHLDMAVMTPDGVRDGQRHYAFDGEPPGAYQFLLRGLVDVATPACGCEPGGAWVLAADVPLAP